MKIGVIYMAAGLASRFGGNKLMADALGQPMLGRILAAAPPEFFDRAVLVWSDERVHAYARSRGIECIFNPEPERGARGTIALGTAAMDGMDAAMYCVCDQPALKKESVAALKSAFRPGGIYVLGTPERPGNPVIFDRRFFAELRALPNGYAGKFVALTHPEAVRYVAPKSADELTDIDTRGDLADFSAGRLR